MDLEKIIAVLLDPNSYPGNPGSIELRQTHASCVFLTERDAYKLKKPVDLGFLDYSTPRRRALMCRREVVLNQRLAPSVYLGVERLVASPGGFRVRQRGRALDYLVHMRRLPDQATLAARLAAGTVSRDDLVLLARRLATFHAAAAAAPAPYGSLAVLRRNAEENLEHVAGPGADVLPGAAAIVREYTGRFFRCGRPLIDSRLAAGRIRDGHGDLRCEHVYFEGDEVLVIDCIEFNRRFRYGDTALDLAFLLMDLEVSGYPDHAATLADEYGAASGDEPGTLLEFYRSYRAMVRAKVAYLRSLETEFAPAERERARLEAMSYLQFAARFTRADRAPLLVLVGGLTGSGKSTVAALAGEVLRAPVYSADETRKRLAGLGPGEHPADGPAERLYGVEMNARVYATLLARAGAQLALGRPAVLDATFRRAADRAAAWDLAREFGARIIVVECVAPAPVIRARLERRTDTRSDPWSDGTWEVYLAQREGYRPFDEFGPTERLVADTTRSRAELARDLLELAAGP